MKQQSRPFSYADIARLGSPIQRVHDEKSHVVLPLDTIIVSADSHYSLDQDIFYERFPARLKDRAPRVWRDENGTCQFGWNGVGLSKMVSTIFGDFDLRPGSTDLPARLADMDGQGVDKEIVFPNAMLVSLHHPDLEVRDWTYRIYNEHLAELQQRSGDRFLGVGLINYWDPSVFAESIQNLKSFGLKTFMLPLNPGSDIDGNKIFYASDKMTPLWDAVEESGLPLCFHIGENLTDGPRGAELVSGLTNLAPFRKICGELIFGGIFDRHPKLQVAFVEGGINWVPSMLQDAELVYASLAQFSNWKLKKDVRSYWKDHMYSAFMTDPLGLRMLNEIGADKVLWSTDYPHHEGTLGYSWRAMEEVVKATSTEDARKILGGNAIKLFNLN